MALDYKVGSFTKSTNTSVPVDQAITGVGFLPKAVILFTGNKTADDVVAAHYNVSTGFSDGTTDGCINGISEDNVSTSDTNRIQKEGKVIQIYNASSAALLAEADLKTLDADGFTLTWTTNDTTASLIKYIAIGGSDITDVEVGYFDAPLSTGAQSVATSIANADFLMVMSTMPTTIDVQQGNVYSVYGVATSSDTGAMTQVSRDGLSTSDAYGGQRDAGGQIFFSYFVPGTSFLADADFTGFTASGFDLNWVTLAPILASREIIYITIKGGQWEVGKGTAPITTPATKAYTTTFQPEGLMNFSFVHPASTSQQNAAAIQFGGSDGTNNVSVSGYDRDNVGTTVAKGMSSSTGCFVAGNTVEIVDAHVDSFNATDFTLDHTTVTSLAYEFIWVVAASDPSSGGSLLLTNRSIANYGGIRQ